MAAPVSSLLGSRPISRTRLIGREVESAQARTALLDDAVSLLTLTGPGGVGKTRLALAVADAAAEAFPDGIVLVFLASLRDPNLFAPTIARALGMHDSGAQLLEDRLVAALRDRAVLLALDNCEHLLPAVALIGRLLQACPMLKVLATSRERLRVQGEREFSVLPLPLPAWTSLDPVPELAANPAVQLFTERVHAIEPNFVLTESNAAAVAEICRRLDGLPLALELAAARMKVLPAHGLLARLETRLPLLTSGVRDAPERQQTLRATIAWSYALLTPEEQAFFRHLAVFVGGFTLDAAAAVAGGNEQHETDAPVSVTTLDLVSSLIDKSLLQRQEPDANDPRFAMLETIREFAVEQLESSGEAEAVRARHAACILALVQQAELPYYTPEEMGWLPRFAAEQGNLRAALAWFERRGETAQMLRLAVALWWFWFARGELHEGRSWLMRAAAADPGAPPGLRAAAVVHAGQLALYAGEQAEAEALLGQGLAAARAAGEAHVSALAVSRLGELARQRGDPDRAEALLGAALGQWRAVGKAALIASVLQSLGDVAAGQGHAGRAADRYAEAAILARTIGFTAALRWCENGLGLLALARGDHREAAGHFAAALPLGAARTDSPFGIESLTHLAALAVASGHLEPAARLLGAAAASNEAMGVGHWPAIRAEALHAASAAEAALGPEAFAVAWDAGRALGLEAALREALALAEELAAIPAPVARPDFVVSAPLRPPGADRPSSLSAREQEVLRLIAAGRSNAEIAEALSITPRTASTHASHMLDKLGLSSRAELIAFAHRAGLA